MIKITTFVCGGVANLNDWDTHLQDLSRVNVSKK